MLIYSTPSILVVSAVVSSSRGSMSVVFINFDMASVSPSSFYSVMRNYKDKDIFPLLIKTTKLKANRVQR